MEINAQINTFNGGMNLDTDVNYIDKSQYKYAENVRIVTNGDGTTGVLQGIEKNKQFKFTIDLSKAVNELTDSQEIIGTATTKWFNKESNKVEDCAVIITLNTHSHYYENNSIYVATGFDTHNSIEMKHIVSAKFNITEKVSIVTNYESQYVSNIYFTDGNGLIKVVNLQKTYDAEYYKDTEFDIIPDAQLNPFRFKSFCTGSLKAGQVQYAYKLFNKHGSETSISPLSKKIPLTEGFIKTDSQQIKGQRITENTGLGCQLSLNIPKDNKFEYIRIYRIFYSQNNQLPDVTIVDEFVIGGKDITYQDTGNDGLSVLTVDEINALIPYQFKAQTLETIANRLFAANIQEDTWDIEYDARAYRCDIDGNIQLNDTVTDNNISGILQSDGTITKDGVEVKVPFDHDCINPSNLDLFTSEGHKYSYGYSNGNLVRGGSGPNVSYRFLFTELIQSDTNDSNGNYPVRDLYMRAGIGNGTVTTYYEDNTVAYTNNYGSIIPNYSNAHICANYTGYRRDEIYRFGIVFYNQKMVPSPVHWIGDIRMPASDLSTGKIFPFHCGAHSSFHGKQVELLSYALGVEFTVNNIPQEAVAYEIVRCDRTEHDATITTQGAISKLVNFRDWTDGKYHVGIDLDIRPQAWLNVFSDGLNTKYYHGSDDWDYDEQTFYSNYYEFVSPEVSISKEAFLPNINDGILHGVYWSDSYYPETVEGTSQAFNLQKRIYKIYDAEEATTIDNYDNTIGKLELKKNIYYIYTGYGPNSPIKNNGFAAVFKYYNNVIAPSNADTLDLTIANAIVGNVLPAVPMTLSEAKTHLQPIGNKKYINTSVLGYKQYANHGISCIIQLNDNNGLLFDLDSDDAGLNNVNKQYVITKIYNVKKKNIGYNGNSYAVRSNSVYLSCGAFSTDSKVMCYGGDTYLNIFEFQNTTAIQYDHDVSKQRELRICTVCYIPLESSINLDLRRDQSYSRTVQGDIAQNLIQNDITIFPNVYSQTEPLYQYNSVYSAQSNALNYVPKSLYAEDDLITNNRITCSEAKLNNEIIDNWTKFKFANYIDVDIQYGPVTNLKVFKNKLYYFQDSAVGIAAVNERSLITDNNPGALTLGTGDILARFDYLVEHNGSSIINDRSIIDSNNALYWYDRDKNVICQLGQGFLELSKAKNIQSYLYDISYTDRLDPMSMYDAKYNEIQFRIHDKNIVFNENLNVFTSFYTHTPDFALQFSDKLVSIKGNKFFLHNKGYTGLDCVEEVVSKVKFIVNDNVMYTKVFDNQMFSADLIQDVKCIREINTSTKHQKSDIIYNKDIDYREDTYRFAIPRERQMPDYKERNKSYAGRMRGKYLICDYTFDCSDDKEFRLPYIKTTYRYSML